MKILTLIVHTHAQQALSDLLRSIDQVSGYTFTHVEGHGSEIEKDAFVVAHDQAVGYVPRIRTDLLLEDAQVDSVLEVLSQSQSGIVGQGFYWVTSAEKGGHL